MTRDLTKVMSSLMTSYNVLLNRFVASLEGALDDNLLSIVLYGSVARGQARLESDVDILLVLREASPVYWERLQPVLSVLRLLRKESCWKDLEARGVFPELNVIVLSREEAAQNRYLYLDMIEEAQILLDRDGFFRYRLKVLQARLQELGAKKVKRDGSWYWDLKPDLKLGERIAL